MKTTKSVRASDWVSDQEIKSFHDQGFVHIRNLFTRDELEDFRSATLKLVADDRAAREGVSPRERSPFFFTRNVFMRDDKLQLEDAVLRDLTFHPRVTAVAEALAGCALRLYKAGTLSKEPGNAATVIHDDESQYPFTNAPNTLTIWIPMDDLPVERGCMIFLPGSHRRREPTLPTPVMGWAGDDVFRGWPELAFWPRVSVPVRAGDCTFHHARMVHSATPNTADGMRVAYATTYIDAAAIYRPLNPEHPMADPLGLEPERPLDMLPLVNGGTGA